MRFSTLFFKENTAHLNGLKNIEFSKPLGSIVALAGKNGSGKSRILNLIENYPNYTTELDILYNSILFIPERRNNNFFTETNLYNYRSRYNVSNETQKSQVINELRSSNYLDNYKKIVSQYIKRIDTEKLSKVISLTQNELFDDFLKPIGVTPLSIFDKLLSNSSIAYFQRISDELSLEKFNIINDDNDVNTKIEDVDSFKKFEKLKFFVEKFIGKKLTSKAKKINAGEPFSTEIRLNGQIFKPELLSPGEKILFSYAILFYVIEVNSKTGLEDCVIIIDEPENHLHPSAQIQLVSAIKSIIGKKGQLWLATHSLPLLASLETEEIYIVKNDTIIPPNRHNPSDSIIQLMETEENSYKLKEFLISSSDWAYSNFMTQCFLEPDVHFTASKSDPQILSLSDLIKTKSNLSVLDFGAGSGRLAKAIQQSETLSKTIQYYCALEPNQDHLEELKKNKFVKHVYIDGKEIPEKTFDLVLLFNVLHEITPEKWLDIFHVIKKCLKLEGYLIIVEDKFLPRGEKIDKYGYIILNEHQILDLFGINHSRLEEMNPLKQSVDNRITFSAIPVSQINPSNETVLTAVVNLKKEIFGKMEQVRENMQNNAKAKNDLSIGRLYAHYSQLFINTSLAEKYLPVSLELNSTNNNFLKDILKGEWRLIYRKENTDIEESVRINENGIYEGDGKLLYRIEIFPLQNRQFIMHKIRLSDEQTHSFEILGFTNDSLITGSDNLKHDLTYGRISFID